LRARSLGARGIGVGGLSGALGRGASVAVFSVALFSVAVFSVAVGLAVGRGVTSLVARSVLGAALLDQVGIISASLADLLAEEGVLEGGSSSRPVFRVDGTVEGVESGDTVVQVVDDVDQSLFDVAAELVPVGVGVLGNSDGGLDVDVEQLGDLFHVQLGVAGDEGFVVSTDGLELGSSGGDHQIADTDGGLAEGVKVCAFAAAFVSGDHGSIVALAVGREVGGAGGGAVTGGGAAREGEADADSEDNGDGGLGHLK
jgi:hypothetical protein